MHPWTDRKGFRKNIKDGFAATCEAAANAWHQAKSEAAKYWKPEVFFVAGSGVVYWIAGGSPLQAVMISAGILISAGVLAWTVLFLWQPFRDHRKLVWERDFILQGVSDARSQYEKLCRQINLRTRMHEWSERIRNDTRTMEEVISRGHSFSAEDQMRSTRELRKHIHDELVRLGQPTLAEGVPPLDEDDPPRDPKEFVAYWQPIDMQLRAMAAGARDIPPFEDYAPDDGLQIPTIYPFP